MENLKTRIAESKIWLQQNAKSVIVILAVLLCVSLIRIMSLESSIESCYAAQGKDSFKEMLPKLK